jgi:lipopolysaccharide biosynthesis glycosyltransferase
LINIVCASDDRYVKHLAVLILSIIKNNPNCHLRFNIIDGGIKKDNIHKLESILASNKVGFKFLYPNKERVKSLKIDKHLSLVTYYRLLIPQLLDKSIEKVLYLDSDIVVNDDIAELFNIDITSYSMAAVETPFFNRHKELSMDRRASYFNAGVLVINLKYWRENNISDKVITFITDNPDSILYHDQDGMNAILFDKWLGIDSTWNLTSQLLYLGKLNDTKNANIIHYTEASKPWHLLNNHPYKNEYEKYLAMTPWKDDIPPENDIILKLLEVKKIIIFGSGGSGIRLLERIKELNGQVSYFLDNNKKLFDNSVCGTVTYLPNKLKEENLEDVFIFIASMYYVDIEKQLIDMGLKRLKHFVSLGFESELIEEW